MSENTTTPHRYTGTTLRRTGADGREYVLTTGDVFLPSEHEQRALRQNLERVEDYDGDLSGKYGLPSSAADDESAEDGADAGGDDDESDDTHDENEADTSESEPSVEVSADHAPFDPSDYNVDELREVVASDSYDDDERAALVKAEKAGKNRSSAIDALEV